MRWSDVGIAEFVLAGSSLASGTLSVVFALGLYKLTHDERPTHLSPNVKSFFMDQLIYWSICSTALIAWSFELPDRQ